MFFAEIEISGQDIGFTLFMELRASTGKSLHLSVAKKAPTTLMKRTWITGIEATSNNDQKPIFYETFFFIETFMDNYESSGRILFLFFFFFFFFS